MRRATNEGAGVVVKLKVPENKNAFDITHTLGVDAEKWTGVPCLG